MNLVFLILTIVFIVVSGAMILIILVQRPQGGGLAGAFGGAGGGSTDTVFGGRVGDALTVMTVVAFLVYLGLAIGLSLVPIRPVTLPPPATPTITSSDGQPIELQPSGPPPGFNPNTPLPIPGSGASDSTAPAGIPIPPVSPEGSSPETLNPPPSGDGE